MPAAGKREKDTSLQEKEAAKMGLKKQDSSERFRPATPRKSQNLEAKHSAALEDMITKGLGPSAEPETKLMADTRGPQSDADSDTV